MTAHEFKQWLRADLLSGQSGDPIDHGLRHLARPDLANRPVPFEHVLCRRPFQSALCGRSGP